MAHHLASLIVQAKRTDGTQAEATQEAISLILKLWDRRNALPDTADPLSKLTRAINVIDCLGSNSSPFYQKSQDKREADLALLFDGLRQLVAHGVLLVSGLNKIPVYTEDTFEYLSEDEQQIIIRLGGWVAYLAENKPKTPIVEFVHMDEDAEIKKTEEAAEVEQLEPDERSRALFSRSVDELIEKLQIFKKDMLNHS